MNGKIHGHTDGQGAEHRNGQVIILAHDTCNAVNSPQGDGQGHHAKPAPQQGTEQV